jgi:hypothetical protein
MNAIKIRAWDTVLKSFSYSGYGEMTFSLFVKRTNCERYIKDLYIGTEDKNGKEIYANDIEKGFDGNHRVFCWHFNRWVLRNKKGKIEEINKMWADYHKYEIIGNEYENPELLRGKK